MTGVVVSPFRTVARFSGVEFFDNSQCFRRCTVAPPETNRSTSQHNLLPVSGLHFDSALRRSFRFGPAVTSRMKPGQGGQATLPIL